MRPIKQFKSTLDIEDMENGGNQKVFDAINQDLDQKELKKLVSHLRRLDLKYTNFDYLKKMLMPLMNGYFISSTATNIEEPIYRAVSWSTKPTNKEQLGCPPAYKVKLGRANNPEKPVFYGSAGCHSTIIEVAPNQGDRLVISKWHTKASLRLVCAGYTENAFKKKSGVSRLEELPWVNQHIANPRSNKKGNQIIHEFLAREFTKKIPKNQEWKYKISAAISEISLNALSFGINDAPAIEVAGILYPSTPNEANADNVALRSHIAEKYLDFVSAQYIEIIQKTDRPEYTMRGLDFADSLSDTGNIQWQNSFPHQLIAGSDHTARYSEHNIEILDNKNVVVGNIPYKSERLITGAQ